MVPFDHSAKQSLLRVYLRADHYIIKKIKNTAKKIQFCYIFHLVLYYNVYDVRGYTEAACILTTLKNKGKE